MTEIVVDVYEGKSHIYVLPNTSQIIGFTTLFEGEVCNFILLGDKIETDDFAEFLEEFAEVCIRHNNGESAEP